MHYLLSILWISMGHTWGFEEAAFEDRLTLHILLLFTAICQGMLLISSLNKPVWSPESQGHCSATHLSPLSHDLKFCHLLVSPWLPLTITTPTISSLLLSSESIRTPFYSACPALISGNCPWPTPETWITCALLLPAQQMSHWLISPIKNKAWNCDILPHV